MTTMIYNIYKCNPYTASMDDPYTANETDERRAILFWEGMKNDEIRWLTNLGMYDTLWFYGYNVNYSHGRALLSLKYYQNRGKK